MDLKTLFREYCKVNIADKTKPLSDARKKQIISELKQSPFREVVQAYSVLDFYDYKHLAAEGFDRYFGYQNEAVSADNILDMVHPDDREAFGKLYYLCLEGLMNMPVPTKGIGHFCISYRMKDVEGNYHRILETNNIIECDADTNIPLINLALISLQNESTHKRVTYYFNIKDEQCSEIMQAYLSQYDARVNVFTRNELKIVRLIKQGLTSKQIADDICLSKHSVDKYRKNLLEKTDSANTPQLIAYLESIGLI